MKKRAMLAAMSVAALALLLASAPVLASLTKTSTKTKGYTTITWDSAFADMDYTVEDTISLAVTWTVVTGAATYDSFVLRNNGFTPTSEEDPAAGEVLSISQSGTTVSVEFRFTDLHWDAERMVDIGNAHFKLYLWVDEDGDGYTELLAGFGVNVHVEDPA